MPNKEIELKYKIDNPKTIEERLSKLKAKFVKEFRGIDSYFLVPENTNGMKYLRVREKDGKSRLDYHYVNSTLDTDEWETEIEDCETMKEILRKIGHTDDVIVDKMRKVYNYKNSEIVIDNVKGLGYFVEIESPSEKELFEIEKEMGFKKEMQIWDKGYPDMVRGYLIGQENVGS